MYDYENNYRKRDDSADDGNLGAFRGVGSVQLDLLDRARVQASVHLADDLHAVLVGSCGVDRGGGQDDREQWRDRRQPEDLLVPPPLGYSIVSAVSRRSC